jgi:prepilin-type N-terminal cleavage/methylation domain-containing protein
MHDMTNRQNNKPGRADAGVTLLEMIIVLVIIGLALMMLANYKRKEAKQTHQNVIAEMIVRDISGVLKFTAQTKLDILDSDNNPATKDNPLYDDKNPDKANYNNRVENKTLQDQPDTEEKNFYSAWSRDPGKVSQVSTVNGSRYLFLGSECRGPGGAKGALKFKLADTMLPCEMRAGAEDFELVLERVDFVNNSGSTGSLGIQRIDFYLTHQAEAEEEGLHFTGFIKPLEKALRNAGLGYIQAAVVEITSSGDFKLIMKNSKVIEVSDVASNMDLFDTDKRYGIRLSFDKSSEYIPADGSVPVAKMCWNDVKGEGGPCISAIDSDRLMIKTSDAAGKNSDEPAMCWDKEQKQSTLCLAAMNSTGVNPNSDNPDERILHLRTTASKNNVEVTPGTPSSLKGTTGTLYANIVMENTSRRHPAIWHIAYNQDDADKLKDGFGGSKSISDNDNTFLDFNDAFRGQYELVTPAVTFYQSFKNDYAPEKEPPEGADDLYRKANDETNYKALLSEPGVIRLPLQTCPRVEGKPSNPESVSADAPLLVRKMYPRLSVAISSVAADDNKKMDKQGYTDYTQQGAVRANSEKSGNPVGAIAGVAVQANIVVDKDVANNADNVLPKKEETGLFEDWISDDWFNGDKDTYHKPFWLISATSSTIDPDGNGTNKINPQSLSVIITQWCSTIPQGGIISSDAAYNWDSKEPHKYLLHSVVAEDTDLKFYNDSNSEIDFPDHERITY